MQSAALLLFGLLIESLTKQAWVDASFTVQFDDQGDLRAALTRLIGSEFRYTVTGHRLTVRVAP